MLLRLLLGTRSLLPLEMIVHDPTATSQRSVNGGKWDLGRERGALRVSGICMSSRLRLATGKRSVELLTRWVSSQRHGASRDWWAILLVDDIVKLRRRKHTCTMICLSFTNSVVFRDALMLFLIRVFHCFSVSDLTLSSFVRSQRNQAWRTHATNPPPAHISFTGVYFRSTFVDRTWFA